MQDGLKIQHGGTRNFLSEDPKMRGFFLGVSTYLRWGGSFTCLLVLLISLEAAGRVHGSSRLVVVIYPDGTDAAPGIVQVNHAIRAKFAAQSQYSIEINNEYVNTARLPDTQFMAAQVELLKRKYANRKIDLVIAGLSSGLDFAMKYRSKLFPGVPIVFVAVDSREVKLRSLPPDVYGTPMRMDLEHTLNIASRLHPNTKRFYVVAGNAPFDREWALEAQRLFRNSGHRADFEYLIGQSMAELLRTIASLPENSVIYYLHIHEDGNEIPFVPAEALDQIAAVANAPIYSHVGTYIGRGVVGGRVFEFDVEGAHAAEIALRILNGQSADTLGSRAIDNNQMVFDDRQLQRWSIVHDQLPEESIVRFKQVTFWREYKARILGGIAILAAQTLLIAALFFQRAKRIRADRRFSEVIEADPSALLIVDAKGKIVSANQKFESLFGFAGAELVGKSMDDLFATNSVVSKVLLSQSRNRDEEYFGKKQSGEEIPTQIFCSPIRTRQGLCSLIAVIDRTEAKRTADLIVSNRKELQSLTGRLLHAHESEARRIARELHDDLNQSLALVSVELDLLRGSPLNSADLHIRLGDIATRVRNVSSTVSHLSHKIHPNRLEQLGLESAICSLCKELTDVHELEVSAHVARLPITVSRDVSLCVYRIAQESLRNVIKHSGTKRVRLELCFHDSTLKLSVADDGVGFDLAEISTSGGLGLASIRERLSLLGGVLEIHSRSGQGTRILARLPMEKRGLIEPVE